jgi:hypothetical protein
LTEKLATLLIKKSAVYKLTWMQPDATAKNYQQNGWRWGYKPIVDLIYSSDDGIDAYEYLVYRQHKESNYSLSLNSLKSELQTIFVAK